MIKFDKQEEEDKNKRYNTCVNLIKTLANNHFLGINVDG